MKHDVRAFPKKRQTLEAWLARKLIGMHSSSDESLRSSLIDERLKSQHNDGSWGKERVRDATTYLFLKVLLSVGESLPLGCLP